MQLKLLNFYRLISKIANGLVGAFIPLIILKATGNITYSFLVILGEYSLRIILNYLFRKLYFKYPQLFLLIKIVPIILVSIFLFLLDTNFVLGAVGATICYAFANSFSAIPEEVVFSYSSVGKGTEGSLGLTRLFNNMGVILGILLGGFVLDYINKTTAIIMSASMYLIAVIPLVVFFIRNMKNKGFNKEGVSNAVAHYESNNIRSGEQKRITLKMLTGYFLLYMVFCTADLISSMVQLSIFIKLNNMFSLAGIAAALFNGAFGIFAYIYGKIESKYDTTNLFIAACLTLAGVFVCMAYAKSIYVYFYLMFLFGALYPVLSSFFLTRLLTKTRIMGVSNTGLLCRENGAMSGVILNVGACLLFGVFGGFIVAAILFVVTAVLEPINEEHNRKMIVDFIQDNIKVPKNKTKKRIKKKT